MDRDRLFPIKPKTHRVEMPETSRAAWRAPAALVGSCEHLPARVLQDLSKKAHPTIANENYNLWGALLYFIFLNSKPHPCEEQTASGRSRLQSKSRLRKGRDV